MWRATRRVALVAIPVALGACAAKPPRTDRPALRKIALIPATEPESLTLKNENGVTNVLIPISSVAFLLDSKEKAKRFNDTMVAHRPPVAKILTTRVADTLRAKGYTVDQLTDIDRPTDDPDDVDFQKLRTDAEAILQLRVAEVGLYSSKLSTDYLPRVNIQAKMYFKSIDDSLYDENLYFGVDATPGDPTTIVADPKFAYSSFETVMAKTDEIERLFADGIDMLAKRLADQLVDTLQKKARLVP